MPLWARRNRIRSVNPKGFGEGEPAFDALHKRFHARMEPVEAPRRPVAAF